MGTRSAALKRLDRAKQHLEDCRLCPRDCRVNRLAGEKGWCGAGAHAAYFQEFVHYAEEPELCPSHTIYLTGCNLRCAFCHTAAERTAKPATLLTHEGLTTIIARGRRENARNLNLLGGEPTVNLPGLLALFAAMEGLPPIVWNSNLYCTEEALALCEGVPDIYLIDLKFGNRECSARLAAADDYVTVVRARLKDLYGRGRAESLIIRHLVLPGHLDCCTRPSLEWIAKELPGCRVSLKTDYLVMPAARCVERVGRFLTSQEICQAEKIARDLGLSLVQNTQDRGHSPTLLAETDPPKGPKCGGDCALDVELVISPAGEVFVRHPTREALKLALRVTQTGTLREEIT